MITLKSETMPEGVGVMSEIEGKPSDVGLEALHLIAVLMTELKNLEPRTHAAVLQVLAEDSDILLGEYVGAEQKVVKGGVN